MGKRVLLALGIAAVLGGSVVAWVYLKRHRQPPPTSGRIDTDTYQVATSGMEVFRQEAGGKKLTALIGYVYRIDSQRQSFQILYGQQRRAIGLEDGDEIKLVSASGKSADREIALTDLKIGDFVTVNLAGQKQVIIKQTE